MNIKFSRVNTPLKIFMDDKKVGDVYRNRNGKYCLELNHVRWRLGVPHPAKDGGGAAGPGAFKRLSDAKKYAEETLNSLFAPQESFKTEDQ